MNTDKINEQQSAVAFTSQAPFFDELYTPDKIIQYKRGRVRSHLLKYMKPGSSMLELNSGTGDDAVFFAGLGHYIHATDISEGMQDQLKKKITAAGLTGNISTELCSFTSLNQLQQKGPYDVIFSNFAGLNCTNKLGVVLDSFDKILKPGGLVTLVILPKFCLWEMLLIFKGKFSTAMRRFFSKNGRSAKIGDARFTCWYYSPEFIIDKMKGKYTVEVIEGLCTIVPPSYLENFAEKYPRLFTFLCRKEDRLKEKWPWKFIGDYFIISLRKK